MKNNTIYILILLMFCSCSTTRLIEPDEQLYIGIDDIEFEGKKEYASTPTGKLAISDIEEALASAPNGSIAGSSKIRGIPFGLWWYNAYANSKSKIGKWFFRTFATTPILVSPRASTDSCRRTCGLRRRPSGGRQGSWRHREPSDGCRGSACGQPCRA